MGNSQARGTDRETQTDLTYPPHYYFPLPNPTVQPTSSPISQPTTSVTSHPTSSSQAYYYNYPSETTQPTASLTTLPTTSSQAYYYDYPTQPTSSPPTQTSEEHYTGYDTVAPTTKSRAPQRENRRRKRRK